MAFVGAIAYTCSFLLPLFVNGARIKASLLLDSLGASDGSDSDAQKAVTTRGEISGHVWTSCYCWDDPKDPRTQHRTSVKSFWVALSEEKRESCLEGCGPKCKEEIGPAADEGSGSIYKFTCGDNPDTRRCGLYIVKNGTETSVFVPPFDSCEGVKPLPQPTPYDPSSVERVAIFADYDGCWDIISGSNSGMASQGWFAREIEKGSLAKERDYGFVASFLKNALTSITTAKQGNQISLFVGSNRQSVVIDSYNAKGNGNGAVLGGNGAFELWEKSGIEGVPSVAGWVLEKTLLADQGFDGSAWQRFSKHFNVSGDAEIKRALAQNNIRFLKDKYGSDTSIDVFFFDDRLEYLEYVLHKVEVPPKMRLFIVHYDWMNYAQGLDEKNHPWLDPVLQAIGAKERFLLG